MLLKFTVEGETIGVTPSQVVIAGWTGRDMAAVQHHIDELAAIGVPPPSTVPLYYRVGAALVTQADTIDVVGGGSSGEVEPVLVVTGRGLLLTVGSDHTDRDLEAHSIAFSKQLAGKPIGRHAVRLATVADVDALELSSQISDDGESFAVYQRGTVRAIRPLDELIEGARAALGGLPEGTIIFCGTVPTTSGEIVPSIHFRGALRDPATGETLDVRYAVNRLPVVS
ncbi:DUF2848 domain-containing protein [Acuticoccus mangrovi]|uniref:DUF2848 family protein n=1 Tax=Acuticoccus mangrovi TaxID=2796142 RepID=A0A934IN77_9HYPH|nr:DUF2848 domain-containing protein [Acuticoccus mangrovi]MBJ3775700.1 DUF2848 family protein [Acuticoccus mangrovi]